MSECKAAVLTRNYLSQSSACLSDSSKYCTVNENGVRGAKQPLDMRNIKAKEGQSDRCERTPVSANETRIDNPIDDEIGQQVQLPREHKKAKRSKTWEGLLTSSDFPAYDGDPLLYQSIVNKCTVLEDKSANLGHSDNENNRCDSEETEKCFATPHELKLPSAWKNKRRKMFSKVKTFVVCLSMLQLFQVMGSGYSKSALTSIERRYRLSTFGVGLLQSCFHVGNLCVILFVSYFGSKWNRPRTIAIGSLLMATSSFMSAMPQFVGSSYKVKVTNEAMEQQNDIQPLFFSNKMLQEVLNKSFSVTPRLADENPQFIEQSQQNIKLEPRPLKVSKKMKIKLCVTQGKIQDNDDSTSKGEKAKFSVLRIPIEETNDKLESTDGNRNKLSSTEYNGLVLEGEKKEELEEAPDEEDDYWNDSSLYAFIAVGSVLKGMGHSPLHPLGMSFIDDFATSRNSAVYIGVVSALSLLGPAFGFILGSLTTGTWVDWGWVNPSEVEINPHHPLWVGAWWMGYMVTGFLLLLATIPFCLFPREIPTEKEEDTDQGGCFLCAKSCYSSHSKSAEGESAYQLCQESEQDLNPINVTDHHVAHSKVTMKNDFEADAKHWNDRLREFEQMLDVNATINEALINTHNSELASPKITQASDSEKASGLISFLQMSQGDKSEIKTMVTKRKKNIPFSLSEMKFSQVQHRRDSSGHHKTIKKSRSVPAAVGNNHDQTTTNSSKNTQHCEISRRQVLRNLSSRNSFTSLNDAHGRQRSQTHRRPSRLEKMVDFTASLKGLLTDPVFLSITLAFVCLTSFLAASVTYVSKYMETQFSLTASFANLLNGSVNLPMAVVGNLLGGWFIRKFDLNIKRTMAVAIVGLTLTIVCVATLLFFRCDQGTHVDYSTAEEGTDACTSACDCGDVYAPVCDVTTNVTYRSACHAGCVDVGVWRGTQIFTGCRCLGHNSNATTGNGILFRGPCKKPDCSQSHLPVFVGVMGSASLTAGLASTPSTLVILRIVPPGDKAFAIGIVFVFTRILAWIPSPVYVGYVIDSACLRWSYIGGNAFDDVTTVTRSDERQHCEIYDKDKLRRSFFAVTGALLVLSIIFYVLALYLEVKRQKVKARSMHVDTTTNAHDEPAVQQLNDTENQEIIPDFPTMNHELVGYKEKSTENEEITSACGDNQTSDAVSRRLRWFNTNRLYASAPNLAYPNSLDDPSQRLKHPTNIVRVTVV